MKVRKDYLKMRRKIDQKHRQAANKMVKTMKKDKNR